MQTGASKNKKRKIWGHHIANRGGGGNRQKQTTSQKRFPMDALKFQLIFRLVDARDDNVRDPVLF